MSRLRKKIRKIIPFTIASKKKKKTLRIKTAKEVKDLYNKNYKTLKKLKKTLEDDKIT
jgi:hypothetical protein